jgi:hypothetical protein
MPSSYIDSYTPIVKLLIERAPRHILEIGPGWGKYGLACREYLPDLDRLDAIEVPQGRFVTQGAIYDNVFVDDARRAPDTFFGLYDLVVLVDVIEHFTLDDGHELLGRIQGAGTNVLVATPKQWIAQHDDRNPHEEHLSYWSWEELAQHGIDADVSTIDAVIYLLKGHR